MRSAPAPSGTLEESQVRAMFDRIAGFYDVMNSVMTAGLHHRWRERAADLARVGPGDRALDVATGTGDLALALARRVRPGGRVVVLEITTPTRPPLSTFFSIWFDRVVPTVGRFAADPEAYTYLPKSVKRFPGPEALGGALSRAGLTDVRWILTAGGIIALHSGTV